MTAQQLCHSPDAIVEIVNLHHDLIDLRPVILVNAGEDLELSFLDVNLQKIDFCHALVVHNLR